MLVVAAQIAWGTTVVSTILAFVCQCLNGLRPKRPCVPLSLSLVRKGCLADYRVARPHTGFGILARWRDAVNRKAIGQEIRTQLSAQQHPAAGTDMSAEFEPFRVPAPAGGFYYCTSNADAHGYDSFSACEIMEVHGNIEVWQCGKKCSRHQWRMPLDAELAVHPQTMLASSYQPAAKGTSTMPTVLAALTMRACAGG